MVKLSLVGAIVILSTVAYAQEKGDQQIVDGWHWVEVVNPTAVHSYNNDFAQYSTCGINAGGIVRVIGIDGDRLLLRYTTEHGAAGTMCPTGILFFLPKSEFVAMTGKFSEDQKKEQAEADLVRRLLNEEKPLPPCQPTK